MLPLQCLFYPLKQLFQFKSTHFFAGAVRVRAPEPSDKRGQISIFHQQRCNNKIKKIFTLNCNIFKGGGCQWAWPRQVGRWMYVTVPCTCCQLSWSASRGARRRPCLFPWPPSACLLQSNLGSGFQERRVSGDWSHMEVFPDRESTWTFSEYLNLAYRTAVREGTHHYRNGPLKLTLCLEVQIKMPQPAMPKGNQWWYKYQARNIHLSQMIFIT